MFKRSDWIVGLFSVLLGIFTLYNSSTWHEKTNLDPAGPGGVPSILAWGILIIGIIHLAGVFLSPKLPSYNKTQWIKEYEGAKPILRITLVCIIYILVLEYIGYLIATPLLIMSIMWVINSRDIKNILLTSVITTAVLFLIFGIALKVRLPMGFLNGLL